MFTSVKTRSVHTYASVDFSFHLISFLSHLFIVYSIPRVQDSNCKFRYLRRPLVAIDARRRWEKKGIRITFLAMEERHTIYIYSIQCTLLSIVYYLLHSTPSSVYQPTYPHQLHHHLPAHRPGISYGAPYPWPPRPCPEFPGNSCRPHCPAANSCLCAHSFLPPSTSCGTPPVPGL